MNLKDLAYLKHILIKICSLSTPAAQNCICQLYPVFQSNVDSISESCRYTVWRKLPGSFPEDRQTVNVCYYLYTACGSPAWSVAQYPSLSKGCSGEAPAFSYSLFWSTVNWNCWVSRGSDCLLFPAGFDNNPDLSELPNTQVGNQQTDILMSDSLCCSVIRCHQALLQLASLSVIPPRSSGNASEMQHCGVPPDRWITIQSHSSGFAVTFGCLSGKTKDVL